MTTTTVGPPSFATTSKASILSRSENIVSSTTSGTGSVPISIYLSRTCNTHKCPTKWRHENTEGPCLLTANNQATSGSFK